MISFIWGSPSKDPYLNGTSWQARFYGFELKRWAIGFIIRHKKQKEKDPLNCKGETFENIVEKMRKGFKEYPQWKLDLYFCSTIFQLNDQDLILLVLEKLEKEGVIERKNRIICRECDSGLDFLDPGDVDFPTCDICWGHPTGVMDSEIWQLKR